MRCCCGRCPIPTPDRMVVVRETRAQAGFEKTIVSAREYVDWTRDSRVLSRTRRSSTTRGSPSRSTTAAVRLGAMRVSAEFFPLFGVHPIAGRAFTRDAEQPGSGDVVLISISVWQERFGGAGRRRRPHCSRRRTADDHHRHPAGGVLVHGTPSTSSSRCTFDPERLRTPTTRTTSTRGWRPA